jgi:prevent-host-death family protein
MMHDMKVSSAEFQKKLDVVSDKALTEPVTITRNGRDWLVLMSAEEYERLQRKALSGLHDHGDQETYGAGPAAPAARPDHLKDRTEGLGTRLARRFAGRGLDFDIPEIRGEFARPASFDE